MDRDDVTSAGIAVLGLVAGAVARAVAIGTRVVAAGLGTIEQTLRSGGDEPVPPAREAAPDRLPARRPRRTSERTSEPTSEPTPDGTAQSSPDPTFEPAFEPAFEAADGMTPPVRAARSVTRRSSAGAAARTTPGPRPAKRATARTLPPNLRPVPSRESPLPIKGAAGAAEPATPDAGASVDAEPPADLTPAKKASARKAPAAEASGGKAAAKKAAAKKAPAKKAVADKAAATEATATSAPAAQAPATKAPATKARAAKAPVSKAAAKKAPAKKAPVKKTAIKGAAGAADRPPATVEGSEGAGGTITAD